ncbi:MAG: HEAT repeat domain-containing protein [Myxococcota bacterium]|nr:HEAT repeat domain-containing protein [Myxococcota bacterium]
MEGPDSEDTNGQTKPKKESESQKYAKLRSLKPEQADAMERYIVFLGDESWRIRQLALEQLARFRNVPKLIPGLVESLRSDMPVSLRNAAAEALFFLGSDCVEGLTIGLASSDSSRRKFIVEILGRIGTEEARACLFASINDCDLNVRSAVIESLGRIGGDSVIRELTQRINASSGDLQLVSYLLQALATAGAKLEYEILEQWFSVRPVLRLVGPLLGLNAEQRSLDKLIDFLEDHSRSVRIGAIDGLFSAVSRGDEKTKTYAFDRIGTREESVQSLIAAMVDRDARISERSARILMTMGRADIMPEILRASSGSTWESEAVSSAVKIGRDVVPHILPLVEDINDEVKRVIVEVMEHLRDPRCAAVFVRLALDGEERLAESAIGALARVGEKSDFVNLTKLVEQSETRLFPAISRALCILGRRDPRIAAEITRGLIGVGGPHVLWFQVFAEARRIEDVPILIEGIESSDPELRKAAINAAGSFGASFDELSLTDACEDSVGSVRASAVRALGAFSSESALRQVEKCLDDNDPWVASEAIKSLTTMGSVSCESKFLALVNHSEALISIAAIRSLDKMGSARLLNELNGCLEHVEPDVICEALNAVFRYGPDTSKVYIEKALDSRFWQVRLCAIELCESMDLQLSLETYRNVRGRESELPIQIILDRLIEGVTCLHG